MDKKSDERMEGGSVVRSILVITLIVFCAMITTTRAFATNRKTESDLEQENIRGRVKSYTEFIYEGSKEFGKITKGKEVIKRVCSFDDTGLCIEEKWYDFGNLFKMTIKKRGDEEGTIEKITYDFSNKGEIEEFVYTSWHDNGGVYIVVTFDGDGNQTKQDVSLFDEKGRMKSSAIYTKSDKDPEELVTYEYDINGNPVKKRRWNKTNNYSEEVDFIDSYSKFDVSGNITETKSYDSDVDLIWRMTWKYDKHGNIIENILYDSEGGIKGEYRAEYTYDKSGNWIVKTKEKDKKYVVIEREYEYL